MKRSSRSRAAPRTTLTLDVDELAPGGDAVGHVAIGGDRRAVFVRGAAPGDRVEVAADLGQRPARGELLRVLVAGPARVAAPCAWADACGGCDWMHVGEDARAKALEAHVRRALPEPWRSTEIVRHAAPDAGAERGRARLHVRATGGRAIVGMHRAGTRDPVEVERCLVLHPILDRARPRIAALLEGAHGRGEARIALGDPRAEDRRAVLDLQWDGGLPAAVFARAEEAVRAGDWAGLRLQAGETTRAAVVGDPRPWITAGDGAPLELSSGGFAQASEAGNAALARRVAELAKTARAPGSAPRVVELYAGAGNFTVLLAPDAKEVVAVEASGEACLAARANLERRGLQARVVEGDAGAYAWSAATTLLVLDPPRTGARAVAERLRTSSPRAVLYVSCDPATLGRDLALLAARYRPRAVETFDLFPFTSHVETVVLLERDR